MSICRSNCLVGGQTKDKWGDSRMKTADSRMEEYSCLVVSKTVWFEVKLQTPAGRQQGTDCKQQGGEIKLSGWK